MIRFSFFIFFLLFVPLLGEEALLERVLIKRTRRNYEKPLSREERAQIQGLVKTLAHDSYAKLIWNKTAITKTGDRVNHVHPLRFLEAIFTDLSTTRSLHKLQARGWVWSEFVQGLNQSLKEESEKKNITETFVVDFASNVRGNPEVLFAIIQKKDWNHLVSTLLHEHY